MSYPKKQRTIIEDLLVDENELFELSEQMMMMVGGGYECPEHHDKGDDYDFNLSPYDNIVGPSREYDCSTTSNLGFPDTDKCKSSD